MVSLTKGRLVPAFLYLILYYLSFYTLMVARISFSGTLLHHLFFLGSILLQQNTVQKLLPCAPGFCGGLFSTFSVFSPNYTKVEIKE